MISEKLAGLYTKAEDKYFDALDFLDGKGIPVYAYSDFFENKGIPSFVVTLAIIVAILIILTLIVTYHGPDVGELTLSLRDASGTAMQNVNITITDQAGEILFKGVKSDGDTVTLKRALYNGDVITITADKEGFQPKSVSFTIGEENNIPKISFEAAYEGIEANVRIIDNETKTPVAGAIVIASTKELSYQFASDGNGGYKKLGVPQGVTLLLKITAEGYNEYSQQVVFSSSQTRIIEIVPSNQGFVGKASVAISVKDTDGKVIDDAEVQVIDVEKDTLILRQFTSQGAIIGEVQANIALKIVVKKEGYLTYDSSAYGQNVTIREKEKRIDVTLKQGGQNLHVSVVDTLSGFGVDGAIVQIVRTDNTVFGEATTTVAGADFTGLDPNESVYITVYKEGYLPLRSALIAVSSTEDVKLFLEKVSATNSARLDIYAMDSFGTSINGVDLTFYEIKDGNRLPYGVAGVATSFAGYAPVTVALGKTYEIIGNTDVMEGKVTVEVKTNETDKKVYLTMQKKAKIVEMKFIDVYGKDVYGNARVAGLDGTTLYDGNIANSRIFFNAEEREVVEVQVALPDGNLFTENVTVKGKNYVEVMVYSKDASTLAPVISYVGLEDEQGTEVQGITPGAFYWARFSVVFPRAASKGGVHFRAGSDTTSFALSENFGVYDLSFQGAATAQASSYTPTPAPGNEAVDRSNVTTQGDKSKWIEGALSSPQGTYTVKVKVRAEDFTAGKVQLRYRAWASIGDEYYRAPEDTALGTKPFTDQKSGLYAETSLQEFTMYETLPECTGNICLTTNFVDEQNTLIPTQGFEAIKDKVYGLEVQVTALEADYVEVSVLTDGNTVAFTSTQSGNFNFVRESDFNKTGTGATKASAAVSLNKDGKETVRFFFTGKTIGPAQITVRATGQTLVEKELLFNVVQEKTLLVELSEAQVMAGKNFTVKVTDQGLQGVTNALVKIIDSEGKVSKSITGDGTDGKGKSGFYRVTNDLSVGLYTVEVSAPTYATQTVPLLISTTDILSFADAMEFKLPYATKTDMQSELLTNNSEFTVQNITIQTDGEASKEKQNLGETTATSTTGLFKITAIAPPALGKGQKQAVQVTVNYTGALEETADETAVMTISGLVEGKFLTKVSTTIHMTYNVKLEASCLHMTPSNVTMSLLGTQGSTANAEVEVTNSCEVPLFIAKRVRASAKFNPIKVDAEDIDLAPGETKNINISAYNGVDSAAPRELTYSYEVVYDSNQIKKTLPVTVRVVNPAFALSYPPQITLFLAQSNVKEKAVAVQPLFVTNVSSFPVENIGFSKNREYGSGANITLDIEPPGLVSLEPGQTITPPKLVYASAASKISEPVRGQIEITGKMGQLNNRTGQTDRYNLYDDYYNGTKQIQNYNPYTSSNAYANVNNTLGLIDVMVYYSGYNCLSAKLVEDVGTNPFDYMFPEQGMQLAKKISIINKCAEPVRVVSAVPAGQSQTAVNSINPVYGMPLVRSSVMLNVPQITVPPGPVGVLTYLTVMTAIPNMKGNKYGVVLNGVTEISQTPISSEPFYIRIASGVEAQGEHNKATTVKAKICSATGVGAVQESITVPTISSNGNCGQGYCDAENASKYLANEIRRVISKAQSLGYAKTNQEDKYDCVGSGVCTFENLGMDPITIDLFLQNDAVSSDVVQKELNNKDMETASSLPFRETGGSATGFMVVPEVVENSFIRDRILMGYVRTIFLDRDLRGCGYYRLSISGAFAATVEGISPMDPVLTIRMIAPKLVTKECRDSITNIGNMNPIDKDLGVGKEYGTWLTTIEADTQLKDLAKSIATKRYFSDTRVASGNGNKVRLISGVVDGALAQMCIAGGERKTITVTVDNSISKFTDKASRDTFAQTIDKMVSDALGGSFGDNCLVKNGDGYSCIKLSDVAGIGQRRLELQATTLPLNAAVEGCVEGTVYSNVPEKLVFEVEPNNTGEKQFMGVRKITVSSLDSAQGPLVPLSATTQQTYPTVQTTGGLGAQSTAPAVTPAPAPTTPTPAPATPAKTQAATQEKTVYFAQATSTPTAPSSAPQTPMAPQALAQGMGLGVSTEYYSVEFTGQNFSQPPTVREMELKPNQNSKEYRYYRNVKVCASSSDLGALPKDQQPLDGTPVYVLANGVKFDVAIRNYTEAQPTAKQTITITTGTIHPQDLLNNIFHSSSKGIVPNEPYYFTIMWKEGPPAIDIKAYKDALVRQGKFDDVAIAGAEKTQTQFSLETQNKSSAVTKYMIGCAATSAACNLYGGIGNAIGATLLDCGVPLFTTLREDFLAAYPTAGKGIQAALNALLDVVKAIVGVFGFKPEWKVDWFSTPFTNAQSWSPTEIKSKVIVEGAGAGLAAEALRPSLWGRFATGINKSNIDKWADDIAETYAAQARATLESSIDPLLLSGSQAQIDEAVAVYKKGIAEELSKGLNARYADAMTRTTKNPLKWAIKSNTALYKTVDTSIDKSISEVMTATQASGKFDFSKVLSGKAPGNPVPRLQYILGVATPEEVAGKLVPGSEMAVAAKASFTIPVGAFEEKANVLLGNGYLSSDKTLIAPMNKARTRDFVTRLIEETVEGVDPLQARAKATEIVERLAPGRADTFVIFKGETTTVIPGSGGTPHLPQVKKGVPFGDILDRIKVARIDPATGKDAITDLFMSTKGKLGSGLDSMAAKVNEVTGGKAATDVGKLVENNSAWKTRLKSIFTLRTAGVLGWGIACGALSNAVGMNLYDKQYKETASKQNVDLYKVPSYLLAKGKTYKLVMGNEKNIVFSEVPDLAEMKRKIKNKVPTVLVSQPLDDKLPEERTLDAYPLVTSRRVTHEQMAIGRNDYLLLHANGDQKYVDTSAPYVRYQNPKLQALVSRYTYAKTLDCKKNENIITINGIPPAGAEQLALAIATTNYGVMNYSEDDMTKEAKSGNGWLREHLLTALTARPTAADTMTMVVAKQVFPNATPKDLNTFVTDTGFWEEVYSRSTNDAILSCAD